MFLSSKNKCHCFFHSFGCLGIDKNGFRYTSLISVCYFFDSAPHLEWCCSFPLVHPFLEYPRRLFFADPPREAEDPFPGEKQLLLNQAGRILEEHLTLGSDINSSLRLEAIAILMPMGG